VARDKEVLERGEVAYQVQGGVGQWAAEGVGDQYACAYNPDSDGSYIDDGGDSGVL
jgi:hypothetical protein